MSDGYWKRRLALERALRRETGLPAWCGFHPLPRFYSRQEGAVAVLEKLVQSEAFLRHQIGVFAQEVAPGGRRRYIVDTYAGFCLEHSPHSWMKRKEPLGHYYEVVLQDRPCWLYFDLEYSRETNPKLDTIVAMAAFETVLADFCVQRLGLAVDSTSVLVLDSTSAEKFSKHVLVKRLVGGARDNENTTWLAFANNAQAGLFVSQLVAFARDRQDSIARLLFARPPGRRGSDCEEAETCIIDESVYSRNRCFRLLFQSKFGKSRSLELEDRNAAYFSGSKPHPCLALLASMVTFVPADVCYFRHTSIPPSYDHVKDVYRGAPARGAGVARSSGGFQSSLMQYLAQRWDEVRIAHEKSDGGSGSTAIQSVRTMDDRYQTVTLANNRFCLRKGASHASNSVYLVVDKLLARFHQKCTDRDCHGFRSVKFELPPGLLFRSSPKEVPGMQDGS